MKKMLVSSSAQLISPLQSDSVALPRNPAYKDKGKFFTLPEFLDFAKTKSVPGVLINIQVTVNYV